MQLEGLRLAAVDAHDGNRQGQREVQEGLHDLALGQPGRVARGGMDFERVEAQGQGGIGGQPQAIGQDRKSVV